MSIQSVFDGEVGVGESMQEYYAWQKHFQQPINLLCPSPPETNLLRTLQILSTLVTENVMFIFAQFRISPSW